MEFDLAMTDGLLSTTRAVRKRLDLDRPVPRSGEAADCAEPGQERAHDRGVGAVRRVL